VNRSSFNDDWRVRPKVSHFLELMGGRSEPWHAVRLPHDAMLSGRRDPGEHWGNGFFPGGVWEYEKTFLADEDLRG
jgi:beta-galactosidase